MSSTPWVRQLTAGSGITLSPSTGKGKVQISASGSGEPHIPCNFLVYYSGGSYFVRNGRTGILYSSSDLYTAMNYGFANWMDTYGGRIYIDLDGSHTLNAGWIWRSGWWGAPSPTIIIEGKGASCTHLVGANNVTPFTFQNMCKGSVYDIAFTVQGSGNAIAIGGVPEETAACFGEIRNIEVFKYGTGYGLYFQNYMQYMFANLHVQAVTGSGAILCEQNHSINNCGNSQWDNVQINLEDNNMYGFRMYSIAGSLGVHDINYMMVSGNWAKSGQIAFSLHNSGFNTFYFMLSEACDILLQLTGTCAINEFRFQDSSNIKEGGTFISCSANSYANYFRAATLDAWQKNITLINDASTDTYEPNVYEITFPSQGTGSYILTVGSALLRFRGAEERMRWDVNTRVSIQRGSSGNRGVLKMWDAGVAGWRYAYINNGAWVVSASEPT